MIALGLAFAGAASVGVVLVVSAQSTEDIKHGEALVTRNCARCYATMRTGESTHPEAPAFRMLGKRYPIEALEEALSEGISSGHPDRRRHHRVPKVDPGAVGRTVYGKSQRGAGRSAGARLIEQAIVASVTIDLQNAVEPREQVRRPLALAIFGEHIHHRRRRRAAPWPVIHGGHP